MLTAAHKIENVQFFIAAERYSTHHIRGPVLKSSRAIKNVRRGEEETREPSLAMICNLHRVKAVGSLHSACAVDCGNTNNLRKENLQIFFNFPRVPI